jgi:hypothetical protein
LCFDSLHRCSGLIHWPGQQSADSKSVPNGRVMTSLDRRMNRKARTMFARCWSFQSFPTVFRPLFRQPPDIVLSDVRNGF